MRPSSFKKISLSLLMIFLTATAAAADSFNVCVPGIIAKGGDHYDVFTEMNIVSEHDPLGDMTIAYFRKHGTVPTPKAGRQTDLAVGD